MRITETSLEGAFLIDPERIEDERGFFARTWSQKEFAERGLDPRVVECSTSFNRTSGTLRGMHYQAAPHAEVKLVRCTAGAIHDCIVDLRESSSTFRGWFAIELTAENRLALYVPKGFAHGFLTLRERSEVLYQMSAPYVAASARGVRWDDPAFEIDWPRPVQVINQRDRSFPDFDPQVPLSG
jgi:dTDP-4-dehydrorhamnose 3,5-epimerase